MALPEYYATCGHTSVATDMIVSSKRTALVVNQGGTANQVFVLDKFDVEFLSRTFCI